MAIEEVSKGLAGLALVAFLFLAACEEKTGSGSGYGTSDSKTASSGEVEPEPKPNSEEEDPAMAKTGGEAKDKDFVGLTKAEADKLAKERSLKSRVVEEDGKMFPVTKDLRPDRVNFTVKDGKIVKVTRG